MQWWDKQAADNWCNYIVHGTGIIPKLLEIQRQREEGDKLLKKALEDK
jgi:hypothetical protein